MYKYMYVKLLSPTRKRQIKLLNFIKDKIRDCLKNPLEIASMHCKTFQKFWLDTPLKFTENGYLAYIRNTKLTYYRILELGFLILYGVFLCPYILYREYKLQLDSSPEIKAIYENLSWIHKSLYIIAILSGIGTVLLDRVFQRSSKTLEIGYNSLLNLRKTITQSKSSYKSLKMSF